MNRKLVGILIAAVLPALCVIALDVAKEIVGASKPKALRDLFSLETRRRADEERRQYTGKNH